jgi:hypothetical protein
MPALINHATHSHLPNLRPFSPLAWWRTREPSPLLCASIGGIREALLGTEIPGEPDWSRAIFGDAPTAIRVAVHQMKERRITDDEIDLALSANLACALEGDPACAILISSALRRRSKCDPACRRLSLLWLIARF